MSKLCGFFCLFMLDEFSNVSESQNVSLPLDQITLDIMRSLEQKIVFSNKSLFCLGL